MKTRLTSFVCLAHILGFLQLEATGAGVVLQRATATFSQTLPADFSVGKCIDGVLDDNLGWAVFGAISNQAAAFQTVEDIGFPGGSLLTFSLVQNGNWWGWTETLGRFRISVTTDDRATFCDGLPTAGDVTANWTVLQPISCTSSNGASLSRLADNSVLAGGTAPLTDTYTITAATTLTAITGIRLEVMQDPSLPFNGPGREPPDGNFILSEFEASITPALACVPTPSGLVSWWRAEGDGNDAVGENNGTLFPGTTFGSGEVGQAFSFDGENSAVVVPAAASLAVQSITIEGWIVITDTVLARPIVEFANPTGPCAMNMWYNISPGVQGNSAGLYGFFRDDGGNYVDLGTAPGVLQSNQWNHVALTFQANPSNDVLALYVNGVNVGVTTSTVPVLWNSFENVNLGYRPAGSSDLWGGRRHLGLLDEISIYNRALSAPEILAIYNAGSAGKCAAVVPPAIATQPMDQTVAAGESATFSVSASGTAPLSYQWQFNGGALLGQTGTSLLLTDVQPAQAGNYSVVVTNRAGTALSSNAVLTVLGPTTNCVPPPPGLVGWWRAEGNYSDSAGTNNGTPINSVSIEPGFVGQCFHFVSGPNPRVLIPDNPALALTNSLSIEGWIKPNFGYWILDRGDDTIGEVPYGLGLADLYNLRLSFLIHSSINNFALLTTPDPIASNVWTHVAATLDDATGDMRIYVNGQIAAQTNTTLRPICPLTGVNRSVGIGNSAGTAGFPFDGWIDEISLYSRALSQTEIQAIYNAGSAGKCAAVVPPSISTQPTDQTVSVDGSATFSVGASGTAPLSYQWRFNGGALLGQTGTSLLLTNVQLAQAGNYSVVVTNQAGTAISSNAVLTVLGPTTNCVPVPPGLVGWWRAEGNYSDSVGTNDGTPLNGVSIVSGLVGQAFQFVSGPNPRVYIPDSPTLELTNGLTIEAWLKPNLGWSVLGRGDSVNGEVPYFLGFDDVSSLRLNFVVKSSVNNVAYLRTADSLPTNIWSHVAATLDDNTGDMRIYINGQVVAETNTTIRATCPLTGANRSVCIGNVGGTAGFPFDGLIDEVSLYSRGLSQAEIQAIYNAGSAGKCLAPPPPPCLPSPANLVSWWRGEGSALDSWAHNKGEVHGVTFASGEVGRAFSFNGISDYVHIPVAGNLPDASNLNVGAGPGLTLDAWVNPSDAANGHPIIEWSQPVGGPPYGVHLWVGHPSHPPGYFYANIVDTDGNWHLIDSDPGLMTANVFQHVALTYDKNTGVARLFLNGAIVKEVNLGIFTPQTSYELYFGERPPGDMNSSFFAGLIDEIDVFSRALEPAEIQAIYNASSAGKCVVNRPPVANDFRQETLMRQPVTIPYVTFIAACSDPDEDPLTLDSVSNTSTNGGVVVLSAGVVTYTPPAGLIGSDSFSYTISDGNGGIASASVLVQVNPSPFAAHMLPSAFVDAGFKINFSGYPGATYILQRAESLAGPWLDLGSVTVDVSGNGTLLDSNPPQGNAFYRAVYH